MRNSASFQRNPDQILASLFDALANGLRHLLGLSHPVADNAILVPNHYKSAKAQVLPTLYDFCDTIDRNYLVLQLQNIHVDPFQAASLNTARSSQA